MSGRGVGESIARAVKEKARYKRPCVAGTDGSVGEGGSSREARAFVLGGSSGGLAQMYSSRNHFGKIEVAASLSLESVSER